MRKTNIIIAIMLLASCATTPDDYEPKFHEKAKSIELYAKDQPITREYQTIKTVRSNSCGSKSASRFAGQWGEAKLLLKLEAATLEADAVIDYKCWTNPVDMVSNCWASKRCEGLAVKYK